MSTTCIRNTSFTLRVTSLFDFVSEINQSDVSCIKKQRKAEALHNTISKTILMQHYA